MSRIFLPSIHPFRRRSDAPPVSSPCFWGITTTFIRYWEFPPRCRTLEEWRRSTKPAWEINSMKPPHTILLAEDNPDDVLLAEVAFERAGLTSRLLVVPNGEEAVRYLQGAGPYADRLQFPFPHPILLDLHMPKATGFEVLEWLRHHP